jgi:hypothetical protein
MKRFVTVFENLFCFLGSYAKPGKSGLLTSLQIDYVQHE